MQKNALLHNILTCRHVTQHMQLVAMLQWTND